MAKAQTTRLVNLGLNTVRDAAFANTHRVGLFISNDGTVGGDTLGVMVGELNPDKDTYIFPLLPYGWWEPPGGVCPTGRVRIIWLTAAFVNVSRCFITEWLGE